MKQLINWIVRALLTMAAGLTLTAVAAPGDFPDALLTTANPRVLEVIQVQESVTADLMTLDGILGTAVSEDDTGQLAMVVLIDSDNANRGEIMRALPHGINGVRVAGQFTDRIRAMAVSHTAEQMPPVQLGTSGGWRYDLANGYCCSGTLGCLVQVGTTQYILSNYHVFWGDIVAGGNNKIATAGDRVIQPGMVDIGCNANNAQNVGTLAGHGSLPSANVDAGIAQVLPNMVRTDGSILEIGPISSQTIAASLRQAVKKSGRTTGLSRSTVSGLNATISVQYDTECAGVPAFTKTFTGQILVSNKGRKFLNAGDSGSLMVQDIATKPKAIGLLFAGSSSIAVANPIGDVLTFVGGMMNGTASMVGQ